MAKLVIYSFL